MVKPLYWIEGYHEYDRSFFKNGLDRFSNLLDPIAKKHGLKIEYINLADLLFGYAETPHVYYRGEDILKNEAYTYIPYTNPHPQTEQLLHTLSRIIKTSTRWIQINLPLHLDRDKEQAFYLANLVGAQAIPSWIVPDRTSSRRHVELIEKQLGPYPYILKPTGMLGGMGIIKVENREMLCSLLDYCAQSTRTYLIQPFIKGACDYRVYLENYEVIACQKRSPSPKGFLANISQGGKGEAIEIDHQIETYSKNLARKLTDGYLCIDWLITESETYLSEIDFCGLFFGLPEPERTEVIHAFFRSIVNKKHPSLST